MNRGSQFFAHMRYLTDAERLAVFARLADRDLQTQRPVQFGNTATGEVSDIQDPYTVQRETIGRVLARQPSRIPA